MKLLEERIRKDGVVKPGEILKVDSFLNHQMDVDLFNKLGEEFKRLFADRPVITMSMGGTGLISRLCGEVFGSACTFGAVGKASAPGQIGASDLGTVLDLIHGSL